MKLGKLLLIFGTMTVIGYAYDVYNKKHSQQKVIDDYQLVKEHLLGQNPLHLEKHKPTIWIYLDYERNSRLWDSFYSRNSNNINSHFIYCCLASVVHYCSFDFNICFIKSDSFEKLLPKWNINIDKLSGNTKHIVIQLGLSQILHKYGGMVLPSSTLVCNQLKSLWDASLSNNKTMFCGELQNHHNTHDSLSTFPNHRVIGCKKGSESMKKYCEFLQRTISNDYTHESVFNGELDKMLHVMINNGEVGLIGSKHLGVTDYTGNIVDIDDLFDTKPVIFDQQICMLVVDYDKIKRRTKYGWFLKQNKEQIVENNNVISKFII